MEEYTESNVSFPVSTGASVFHASQMLSTSQKNLLNHLLLMAVLNADALQLSSFRQ